MRHSPLRVGPEEDFVRRCLSFASVERDGVPGDTGLNWTRLLRIATQQGVGPFVAETLRRVDSPGISDDVQMEFQRIAARTVSQNQINRRAVRILLEAFAQAEIPVLVLKGFALLNTVYKATPHLRGSRDIDALIQEADVSRACDVMLELGYTSKAEQRLRNGTGRGAIYRRPGPEPVTVDLQLGLIKGSSPFRIPLAEMWGRARYIPMDGCQMLIFSPEDMILHTAVHFSFCKEFLVNPLRQLRDLGGIAAEERVSWDQVGELASRYSTDRALYYAARLAKSVLDARIADDVLATLESSAGRWEMALFGQVEREGDYLSYRDPLRLFLQTTFLQIPAYPRSERLGAAARVLRRPFAANRHAARLLPPVYYDGRFRPQHILLAVGLLWKSIGIGLRMVWDALSPLHRMEGVR